MYLLYSCCLPAQGPIRPLVKGEIITAIINIKINTFKKISIDSLITSDARTSAEMGDGSLSTDINTYDMRWS